jgi:hypothetical protein
MEVLVLLLLRLNGRLRFAKHSLRTLSTIFSHQAYTAEFDRYVWLKVDSAILLLDFDMAKSKMLSWSEAFASASSGYRSN